MTSTAESERTRGRWRPTRIAVLAALIVAAGLIGFAGLRDALQSSDARGALSDYLDDVQRGDYAGSYSQLCDAVKTGYTAAQHEAFLKSQPAFTSFELDNQTTDPAASGGDGTVTFSVHFTEASGTTSVARISVQLQDNGPRVCDGPNARKLQ